MGKAPAFQMYAADFFMDTNSWTVDQVGIYIRLLMTAWVNGSIPNDEKQLARITGCSTQKFKKSWHLIAKKWSFFGPDKLINKKMEEVRESQQKYSEIKRKAANKRWEGHNAHADAHALHTECPSSSSSSSIKIKDKSSKAAASKDKKIMAEINLISEELYNRGWKEVHAFKNTIVKRKKNLGALLQCLTSCKIHRPYKPWAYCTNIMSKENGNHNEREHTEQMREIKEDKSPLSNLINKIGAT